MQNLKIFLNSRNIYPSKIISYFKKSFFIFSKEKKIKNIFLNIIGIQPLRIIIAKIFIDLRRFIFFSKKKYQDEKRFLINNGYLVINNFLRDEDFNLLCKHFNDKMVNSKNIYKQTNYSNSVNKYKIKGDELNDINCITQKILKDIRLKEILYYVEAKKLDFNSKNISVWYEKIHQRNEKDLNKENDPQTILHRDTFYSSYKIILYLNDIDAQNSAFVYSKKSNKVNLRKLFLEYYNSIFGESPNIRSDNIFINFFKKNEINLSNKANTLIITDVSGFHRRGLSNNENVRNTFRISCRFNPFNLSIKS